MAEENYLVPTDEYLKAGIHIGTKFKTKSMMPFIYKVRPDGLAVLDVQKIDGALRVASSFLAHYEPDDILVACRRENGWVAVRRFAEATGIKYFAGRYPPGVLTNINLENFIEVKLIIVADPFPDRNAIGDAYRLGIPVISLCDTNNKVQDIDLVIPCNNKGKKSLGLVFWILAREYSKARGLIKDDSDFKYKLEAFSPD